MIIMSDNLHFTMNNLILISFYDSSSPDILISFSGIRYGYLVSRDRKICNLQKITFMILGACSFEIKKLNSRMFQVQKWKNKLYLICAMTQPMEILCEQYNDSLDVTNTQTWQHLRNIWSGCSHWNYSFCLWRQDVAIIAATSHL